MYFLSKFLPLFVLPTGLFFILLILGGIEWRKRYRKRIPRLWILAILQWYLFSTPWVAGQLIEAWEVESPDPKELAVADSARYAVVLGGMMEYTGYEWEDYQVLDAADRLMSGIKLLQEGFADSLLLSGGNNPLLDDPIPAEATLMKRWVQQFSMVDTDRIIIEGNSVNTYGNAQKVKKMLERGQQSRQIYLVTSAYHMRRALFMFRSAGLDPIPVATDHRSAKKLEESGAMNWIPSSSALHYSSEILREILGYGYYKWML
jgi:uncharacterized SAM-binding protein YcdF (DUF218 family)